MLPRLGTIRAAAAAHTLPDALLEQQYRRQEGEDEEYEPGKDVVVERRLGEGEAAVVRR